MEPSPSSWLLDWCKTDVKPNVTTTHTYKTLTARCPPGISEPEGFTFQSDKKYVSEVEDAHAMQQQTQLIGDVTEDKETSNVSKERTFAEIDYADQRLAGFLYRPVKIFQTEWAVGDNLYDIFDPWTLYMTHPFIIKKVQNYRYFKAELCVKVMLNGNPFYYGRAFMSYNPYGFATRDPTRLGYLSVDNIERSQRPHVDINPTTSSGGEMILPWVYPTPMASFDSDLNKIGRITIASYQRLEHANVSTTPLSVTVLAWCKNVDLGGPTNVLRSEASDEYGDGIISKPAKAIARMAGALSKVPAIGKYATATEIGADTVSKVASLFGFSRPVTVRPPMKVKLSPMSNMAYSSIDEMTEKLTLDPKQGLTVDPSVVGYDKDEMQLSDMLTRESYLTRFKWETSYTDDKLLFTCYVVPQMYDKVLDAGDQEMHLTPMAYAAQPFKYWRGSITYRFVVATSDYHRGRLRIVYDPNVTSPLYGGSYSRIVDISDTREFEVTIGWNREVQWLENKHIEGYSNSVNFNNEPVTEFTNSDQYSNGVLSVYVLNSLTQPNDADTGDKYINVFVKGGPDLEMAVLTDDIWNIKPMTDKLASESALLKSEVEDLSTDESLKPIGSTKEIPELTLIHFGETFHSIRDILKRYSSFEYLSDGGSGLTSTFLVWELEKYDFPRPDARPTKLRLNTLVSWFSYPYVAWRGGIRHKILHVSGGLGTSTDHGDVMSVTRLAAPGIETSQIDEANNRIARAVNGMAITHTKTQPCLEYEMPFYRSVRFANPRYTGKSDFKHEVLIDGANFDTLTNSTRVLRTFVAAGEDFSLIWLLSMPIMVDTN
jgi:hypothetical protein